MQLDNNLNGNLAYSLKISFPYTHAFAGIPVNSGVTELDYCRGKLLPPFTDSDFHRIYDRNSALK